MAKRKLDKNFVTQTLVIYNKKYTVSGLPDTIKANLTFHGMVQKLVDSTSGMNAKDYTDEERSAKIEEVYAMLKAGNWTVPGTSKDKVKVDKTKVEAIKAKGNATELKVLKELGLA